MGKVHATVYWLIVSSLVITSCDHIQTHDEAIDKIDRSRFTAGDPTTAAPEARGKEGKKKTN